MFGDERASAKEISLFLVQLQGQGSAVSETKKLETHVRRYVSTVIPSPTFANLITFRSQAKSQILAQSVNPFLSYGDGVCTVQLCTCARAGTQGHPTNDLHETHSYWVPNQ